MGTIVTSGVGSGLDVNGLVTKLVTAEGQAPTTRLNQQEADVQGKLSAVGSLRSALSTFSSAVAALKDINKFQGRQATLSSSDFVSASTDSSAAPGSYSIEVQQLASAQKLQSGTLATASTVVGTGTLRIAIGGKNYDIVIDGTNNTLSQIARAINGSAAGDKVIASVVTGASEARLTIAARNTGAANAMTITQSGGDGGLSKLTYPPSGSGMTQLTAALDTRVLIDGVTATSSTNVVSGAIQGVTLTASDVNSPGETTTLSVAYDRGSARKSIDTFVSAYNSLVKSIGTLTAYNATTKQGAPLFGDTGVQNIADQLRRTISTAVAGANVSAQTLSQLGISAQLDGTLTVDSTRLDAAFQNNFDAVGQLFSKDGAGVAVKLDALLQQYIGKDGLFDKRTAVLNASIKDIGVQRDQLTTRLTSLKDRYTKQFNALDTLLAQLQSTSNYLTQQLSKLPGFGG